MSSCLLASGNYAVRVEHFLGAICPASDGFVVRCMTLCSLVSDELTGSQVGLRRNGFRGI